MQMLSVARVNLVSLQSALAVILQLLAGHDLSHLHQISRYIQALESRG